MKFVTWTFIAISLFTSCIHPQVGLRKARLLDPMMDPSRPAEFSEIASGSTSGSFERGITSGGGRTGGSCPTCK
jgi:hypothetical protein